jgi:hypothetical protein
LIGREGAVGGIVSAGHLPAYCRIVVKYSEPLVRMRVDKLEEAKAKSASLRHLFSRYADCLLAQMFQSSACNAIHSIEQRAAKWIVAAMERTGNSVVPLKHEQLATMLGVGHSYTSRVIQTFKADGILDTRRAYGEKQRGIDRALLSLQRLGQAAFRYGSRWRLSARYPVISPLRRAEIFQHQSETARQGMIRRATICLIGIFGQLTIWMTTLVSGSTNTV